jgi:hypothetical protein
VWSTIQLNSFANIWSISFTATGGSCRADSTSEGPGQPQCAKASGTHRVRGDVDHVLAARRRW